MGPGGEPFNGHPGDGDFFPMQGEIQDESRINVTITLFRTPRYGSTNDTTERSRRPDGSDGSGSNVRSNERSSAAWGRGSNAPAEYGAGRTRSRPRSWSPAPLASILHVPVWAGVPGLCGASTRGARHSHHAIPRART